jgi:iron complex transport system substrate-binding protein
VRAIALATLISLTTLLGACSGPDNTGEPAAGSDPYSRMVTLAPNLAELVFAAGAGDRLVGVSAYSDYPPEVAALPLVGDAFTVDQEQLALLEPDLLLAWHSGTPAHVIDELRQAGYTVEVIRTQALADIPRALVRIGELAGTERHAGEAGLDFATALEALALEFADEEPIRAFYQVSIRPLYTVSGSHYASELIALCGGTNIFSDLDDLAPAIDVEAVIDRDPEVILAGSDAGEDAFDDWRRWPGMAANRYGNHYLVPSDELSRATPRVVIAGREICTALDQARARRDRFQDSQ